MFYASITFAAVYNDNNDSDIRHYLSHFEIKPKEKENNKNLNEMLIIHEHPLLLLSDIL